MMIDEAFISRAIARSYWEDLLGCLEVEVAIAGAGPAGMAAAYWLARQGRHVVVFERELRVGGGMPGGGMMMNRVVLQEEGKEVLEELGVRATECGRGLYLANSLEASSALCLGAIRAGARIFNLVSVEDVVIREERITGLVVNWSAVSRSGLHVDPLAVRSRVVIDATGHAAEVCGIVVRKMGAVLRTRSGRIVGERPMWAERGEREILEATSEVYPGLIVAGMAANAVLGCPRMGAIFGGMLLSGRKAAQIAVGLLEEGVR